MTIKTALITGTSRPVGLGFAVARHLAELDYHVILTARDVSRAEPLAEQLRQDGHGATAIRLDLTDRASMDEAAGYLTRAFGHLDALINNASDMPDFKTLSALDADMDAVRSAMEVDVIGPWALTQSMLPLRTAAPAAGIVNVSSLSALQIATGLDLGASLRAPAYSMAKHMLNVLTTVLAHALEDTRSSSTPSAPAIPPPNPNAETTTATARPRKAPMESPGPPPSAPTDPRCF